MGLFDFFKSKTTNGVFVSEMAFNKNRDNQLLMTPKTIDQLRTLSITSEKELKLEYFFYTNTVDKAAQLATEIGKLHYTVEYGEAAGAKKQFIVTGWTTKMKMSTEVVQNWTKQMCELGYQFDCEFDGWGTQPNQAE